MNLIGEHTDYNDGFVLPVALDADLVVCASARRDDRVQVIALDRDDEIEFQIGARPQVEWALYVAGVAALLATQHGIERGADVVIASDVPQGAGLSSSAALEVATALALTALVGIHLPPGETVSLCRQAELEWAGVQCGVMDQMIVLLGKAGCALLIDCRSLQTTQIPLPDTASILLVDSGASRELAKSAYNQRVAECAEAASLLGVASLRDVELAPLERSGIPDHLCRRARHVVTENARTIAMTVALGHGDLNSSGALMNASHVSLRDDYQVSSPALNALWNVARVTDGVCGGKLTGAGFGGNVVVLAERTHQGWVERTLNAHGQVRAVRASSGAGYL